MFTTNPLAFVQDSLESPSSWCNVTRGVPLGADGYFFLPLWTNGRPGPQPGVLDWYTLIAGVLALAALTIHGAHYVALKTAGDLNMRARLMAGFIWPALVLLTLISLGSTLSLRPELLENYREHAVLFVIPVVVAGSLVAMRFCGKRGKDGASFLASAIYLIAMLAGAAAAIYPNLLLSTTDPALNITIYNAAAGNYTLAVGLIVWGIGMALALAYNILVYRMFRGKVTQAGVPGYAD